jgi:aminopeptidase-like protein
MHAAPTPPVLPEAVSTSVDLGEALHALVRRLFPICRSITGEGVRQTLAIMGEYLPGLIVHEVPTGTPALDWTVPREWNVRDAWVKNRQGERVIDFQTHNLHLMSYSVPMHGWLTRAKLDEHLHSLPAQPDLIPYRTAYYADAWGFCLSHAQRLALTDDAYEVCIDSTLAPGALTYGELLLPGEDDAEVLISCHICHPSLANDNLSGLAVATYLAQHLAQMPRYYSYRFVFVPGTIGSLTWLSRNFDAVGRIRHGLVLTLLGEPGPFTYKKSRRGTAIVDRAAALVLNRAGVPHAVREFSPYGYDERQYCSPGFDLPVGCLSRTPFGEFAEYHTSADNLDFVQPDTLLASLRVTQELLAVLDANRRYRNRSPYGEPQLGRRGLYKNVGGGLDGAAWQLTLLWVLNLSDGQHSLLDIAERAGLPFQQVQQAASALAATDLLEILPD